MMKDRGLVDLHMHCRASDGTDTVHELLERVRAAGITTFAVTDHDTIEGAVEMESIVPDDMNFIRGVEFSCITDTNEHLLKVWAILLLFSLEFIVMGNILLHGVSRDSR